MTAAQLRKMQEGREAALERRREQHVARQADYMEWVKAESESYAIRELTHDLHGRDSDEFREAHEVWARITAAMPSLDFVWQS